MNKIFVGAAALLLLLLGWVAFDNLSGTATTTTATCPLNGTITVTTTGGTAPYKFSIVEGPATRPEQSTVSFDNLPAGVYTVRIEDASGASYNITNVVIQTTYVTMSPTATATAALCAGTNSGSIRMAMPAGQGTAPYTYTIESGPTMASPATGQSNSYTFGNLAAGSYLVRVTDACGAFQTREATVLPGSNHNLTIYSVHARPDGCGEMDYYLRPGIGAYYPHTYYAYPGGNLSATPTKITVTGADLVSIPGTNVSGFKFTLPNPATYPGTYYTFKYTDACVTDPTNARVIANTPSLLTSNITATIRNCNTDMDVILGEGWKLPVTVVVTPTAGGAGVTQTITDDVTRKAIFSGLASGSYTVTITDACGKTDTKSANLQTPAPKSTIHYSCGANIPGMSNVSIGVESGWQFPVTGTITSGPGTFESAMLNQTFTATYPIVATASATDPIIRFQNLAPGTYQLTLTDGGKCNTKNITLEITSNFAVYDIPNAVVGGCGGSRTIIGTSSTSCSGGLMVDVKKGNPEATYGNGIYASSGFKLTNVAEDWYSIYYYVHYNPSGSTKTVFDLSPVATYNGNILLKKETFYATEIPTDPQIDTVLTAQCPDGRIKMELIPKDNATRVTGYKIQRSDGSFSPAQESPIFTVDHFGSYIIMAIDSCGDGGTASVTVEKNAPPAIKIDGNRCLGSNIKLHIDPIPHATVVWKKPGGELVSGNELVIVNASPADKGVYEATISYKIGVGDQDLCAETITTSIELKEDCFALPVNWGTVNAVIRNEKLIVNWSTMMESNNELFEVQLSKDGTNFITVGKVPTKAIDGNSSGELKYEYSQNTQDAFRFLAVPSLLMLLALGFVQRRKGVLFVLSLLLISGVALNGCSKEKHSDFGNDNSKIWVRVVQIDKDGKHKASGIVRAIRE